MSSKTLYGRVVDEMEIYDSAPEAAIDHLKMAHAHMHEEFEGRNMNDIQTDLTKILDKIHKYRGQ